MASPWSVAVQDTFHHKFTTHVLLLNLAEKAGLLVMFVRNLKLPFHYIIYCKQIVALRNGSRLLNLLQYNCKEGNNYYCLNRNS